LKERKSNNITHAFGPKIGLYVEKHAVLTPVILFSSVLLH